MVPGSPVVIIDVTNTVTIPDHYPIHHIRDLASNLAGMKFFSKLDLIKGYHQVPVSPDDVPKTAIITPFGLFEYLRIVISPSKCEFGKSTVHFLGHVVSESGCSPLPDKVETIQFNSSTWDNTTAPGVPWNL